MYGLIADNVQIFGSRKRVFFVIGGLLQVVAMQLLFWVEFKNPGPVAYLMFTVSLCNAFLDLIVDTLIVSESLKNSNENGSEILKSLSWFTQITGAISGSILSSYINQYSDLKWTFMIFSFFPLIVLILGV